MADEPYILSAERASDGVLVVFSDGQTALFSSSLLRTLVPPFQVESLSLEESCKGDLDRD